MRRGDEVRAYRVDGAHAVEQHAALGAVDIDLADELAEGDLPHAVDGAKIALVLIELAVEVLRELHRLRAICRPLKRKLFSVERRRQRVLVMRAAVW
mgnify:CR=1 FL=1